jgi:N-sulfoglucosamine sulfohydrolase
MRFFLLLIIFIPYSSVFSQTTSGGNERPNILWITTEDMSPNLPMFGDPTIVTPNLSRLAAEGTSFRHVYSTAGVCAPARSALITGMYQTTMGTHNMRTASGGRAGMISYLAVPPAEAKCFPEYLRANGYYCTNNRKTDYQFGTPFTAWDESSNKAHWRNRPAGKPFFSVFNIEETHESQIWQNANRPLRVDPKKIKLPPYYPDNEISRLDVARYYDNIMIMDSIAGSILQQLKDDGLLENTIVFFFSDHGAGLPWHKREIYNRGLHVPLIVRFPNKANAGSINNDLISLVDFAPTILSLANIKIPAQMQGQAFLGAQRSKHPRHHIFAARDRMDELNDMARAVKDKRFTYVRNYQPSKPYYQDLPYRLQMPMMKEIIRLRDENKLGIHTKRWFSLKEPEELYDTQNDPYELKNLAHDPAYQEELLKFRAIANDFTISGKDKGFIPEKDLIELMWPGGKQPVTAPPVAKITSAKSGDYTVSLSCPSDGASIGYLDSKGNWQIYAKPITVKKGDEIKVKAVRYGYKESEPVTVKAG